MVGVAEGMGVPDGVGVAGCSMKATGLFNIDSKQGRKIIKAIIANFFIFGNLAIKILLF